MKYMGDSTFGAYRTARKWYECYSCERQIAAGDRYHYGIAMPASDVNSRRDGKPWILRLCATCSPEKKP